MIDDSQFHLALKLFSSLCELYGVHLFYHREEAVVVEGEGLHHLNTVVKEHWARTALASVTSCELLVLLEWFYIV